MCFYSEAEKRLQILLEMEHNLNRETMIIRTLTIAAETFKKKYFQLSFLMFLILFLNFRTASAQVVINELGIAPACASCNAAGGGEFIELFNKGCNTVDISCYTIIWTGLSGGGNPTGWTVSIPPSTTLAPCTYYVIGGSGKSGSNWANTSGSGNPWNNPAGPVTQQINASFCTSLQTCAPGNLVDTQGQVDLLNTSGTSVASVSYNWADFSGSYPASSNGGGGCSALNTINALAPSPNNVNGGWSAATSHGIELSAAGTYVATTTLTPGAANATAGQISCSAGAPTALATTPANASCGLNTGSVTIGATTGGTGPFTYNFNSLGFSSTTFYNNLAAGVYSVVVKDSHGCTFSTTATVGTNSGPTALAATPANTSCGGNTGTVTVGATTGGTGPFTYNFNSLGFSATTSYINLASGTYTVVVKDSHGCTFSTTATVGNNPGPTALAATPANTSCGGNTGTVTLGATTGGTGPFTYNFNNLGFSSTTSYTNLASGTYTVVVKDANGCTFSTTSVVGNNAGPTALTTTPVNTNCGANTGAVTIGATTGGTGPFTYNFNSLGFSGTMSYNSLAAGTYTVIVKDAHGCTFSTTASVGNNSGPSALATTPVNSNCGTNTGSVTIGATTGGTAPYSYNFNSLGFSATTTFNNLASGTYTVLVKDANGCTFSTTATVGNNSGPTALATTPAKSSCGTNNGSVSIGAVTGGTGPFTYNFNSLGFSAATSFNSLAAGTYTVIVKDANGCSLSTTAIVGNNAGPAISSSAGTNAKCNAGCTGSATVTPVGGNGTLTYSWSPSGGTLATTSNTLCSGTYTCTVTDALGCLITQKVTLTDPAAIVISTSSVTAATCNANDGAAAVSVAGGTGTYTYSWSPSGGTGASASGLSAGSYNVLVTDANNCPQNSTINISNLGGPMAVLGTVSNVTCNASCNGSAGVTASGGTGTITYSWSPSGGSSATATSLCAGSYTCNINDANNCKTTQAVVITEPGVLAISATQINVLCNANASGSATANVSGGTSNYTYSWTPSGGTGSVASGLSAGVYTCSLNDANGCLVSQTYTITQPPLLTSSSAITNATCAISNGKSTVTAVGGLAAYTYSWSPSGATTDSITGAGPGTYVCTITDANGCTKTDTSVIANVGTSVIAGIVHATPTTFCQGDSVILSATGGGTYSWSTGATTDSLKVTAAGTYSVTVTNSCGNATASAVVVISPLPVAVITGAANICKGDSVQLTASGGTSYLWNPGGAGASIYVSTQGNYTVTAHNACGNSSAVSTINVNSVTSHFTADSTAGYASFSVNFLSNSSATATSWIWNFGDGSTGSGQTPTHVYGTAGTYTASLTVTDANGCSDTYSIVITVSDLPSWILVPNIFTPNGDGTNDLFLISSKGLTSMDLKIYDRWGVQMANITSVNEGWDGRTKAGVPASDGTYYYVFAAKGDDKKDYNRTGYFQLIH